MKENTGLKVLSTLTTTLTSLALAAFSFYLGFLKIYWFYPFAGFFLLDALFTLIGSNKKDRYNGMLTLGRWQAFSVVVVMVYLLAMILWDDKEGLMPYNIAYIVIGVVCGIKLLFAILTHIAISRYYQPILHAHRNHNVIEIFFLLTLLTLTITNQYFPGTGNGLLQEKPLWIYIIDVSVNGTFTILVVLYALSTVVRAKEREEMSTAGKIKHLLAWMNDNEISMFFSLIFSLYLIGLALMNVRSNFQTNWFYLFLAIYYTVIAGIRIINYLWHRTIMMNTETKMGDNRKSSWILLFNAFAYSLFSDVLAFGAIMLMTDKVNAGSNIYLFLFITVPFGILKFILAARAIKSNKDKNNTYRLGLGLIALINAMFSLLEIIAISIHDLTTIFKWFMIVVSVIAVKIFVLVISVIFVIHFFRSLIINRRGKEKKAQ